MNRHLIIGDGNLGTSIENVFSEKDGHIAFIMPTHVGKKARERQKYIEMINADYIWWCAGGVTVGSPILKMLKLFFAAINTCRKNKDRTFIYFGSYYDEQPRLSLYARLQRLTANIILKSGGYAWRVGCLAGTKCPEKTIISKVRRADSKAATPILLPFTDTDVLAKYIGDTFQGLQKSEYLVPQTIYLPDLVERCTGEYPLLWPGDRHRPLFPFRAAAGLPTAREMLEGYLKKIDG